MISAPLADTGQPRALLSRYFGYQQFRHHQADIIETIVSGEDALVLMPTGGGKSVCYQIPSLIRQGVGVVISPLIALMQDQVDSLQALGVRCAYINSSQDIQTRRAVEQALKLGELDLLYIAPERLLKPGTLALLEHSKIALFAIDEAHCVSQWGHDFRPEYQQLKVLATIFPGVPRVALTATADQRTRQEIIEQLSLHDARQFINSFDRPNINYTIAEGGQSKQKLWQFLQQNHNNDAGIVYCLSRKKVDDIAAWLSEQGRTALPYHAGLASDVRAHNQSRFLKEEGLIMVATIAFGMGIDKPDVRFVAHLNLPKSIEAYYQETGRAGRDGEPANAWMAYQLNDIISLSQMLRSGEGSEHYQRISLQKLDAMLALCEMTSCRRQTLLAYFDETLEKGCGNCDNCLTPPVTWDGTEAAQKALSCVYRTGQRFGVNYLVDVLHGSDNPRIQTNQHHLLSTFGIGKALGKTVWRGVFRQLIARGYLQVDVDGYGSIRLTEKCRTLLRGEQGIHFRESMKPGTGTASSRKSREKTQTLASADQTLFEELKALRKTLAQQQNVPPYVVFHDRTLLAMASNRPGTEAELEQIPGIGVKKLERYGEDFLNVIALHPRAKLLNNRLSASINETLALHLEGLDTSTIAERRQLDEHTILTHFADGIESGLLSAEAVLDLDEAELELISAQAQALNTLESGQLEPLFEALDGAFERGVLKCVVADLALS